MGGNDRVIRQKLRHKLLMVSLSLSLSVRELDFYQSRWGRNDDGATKWFRKSDGGVSFDVTWLKVSCSLILPMSCGWAGLAYLSITNPPTDIRNLSMTGDSLSLAAAPTISDWDCMACATQTDSWSWLTAYSFDFWPLCSYLALFELRGWNLRSSFKWHQP